MTDYATFIAGERFKFAAEQERRRDSLSQRVTAEDIVAVEQQQVAEQPDEAEEFDPWLNVLTNVERRAGVRRVYNVDGQCEFRIATRYLLTSVIGVEPEKSNWSSASARLGILMRRLNWSGPKDLRMGKGQPRARGYSKLEQAEK